MKTFNRYLSSIKKNVQVLDLPAADLDRILSKFCKDVRKINGDEYEPDTLSGFSEAYRGSFPMENLILTSLLIRNLRRRVNF